MKRWLFILLGTLALSGCGDTSPVDFPPLGFTRYHPIYLNVSRVEFVTEYKSPLRPPYVEHLMPYSPEDAMRIWVKDRIRAVGPDKFLQVIIKDASVIATELQKTSGVEQLLSLDTDRRYDATLEVEMRIYGYESALSEANVRAKATRSFILSESAGAWQRSSVFRQMVGELMQGINAELEKNMFQYMGGHINYSQNP